MPRRRWRDGRAPLPVAALLAHRNRERRVAVVLQQIGPRIARRAAARSDQRPIPDQPAHDERRVGGPQPRVELDRIGDPSTAEAALKTCEEIDKLESDADRVMRSAMSKLFREEPDVREVIKLKAIYELLETITDKCEDVANVIPLWHFQ